MPAPAVRLSALWLSVVLALAACAGGNDDGPAATVPATTASTVAADPYAIPATINVAYVQRVFDALDEIDGAVFAEFLTKRQITPEMGARLATIYNADALERELKALADQLRGDLSVFKNPPGIRRTVVERLLTTRPDCISLVAMYDNRAVLKNPRPPTPTYIALQRTNSALDPANLNPTPYSIADAGKDFRDSCAG